MSSKSEVEILQQRVKDAEAWAEAGSADRATLHELLRQEEERNDVLRSNLRQALEAFMKMTNEQYPAVEGDPWKNFEARQVLQDCMLCMKGYYLVEDYDYIKETVSIKKRDVVKEGET